MWDENSGSRKGAEKCIEKVLQGLLSGKWDNERHKISGDGLLSFRVVQDYLSIDT